MDCSEDNGSSDDEYAQRLFNEKDQKIFNNTIVEDKEEDCCSSEDESLYKKPYATTTNLKEFKTFKNFDVIS